MLDEPISLHPARLQLAHPSDVDEFVESLAAFERGAVRYVAITNSNRGGAVSWTWSLDEPCVQIGPRASGSTNT